MMLEGLEWDFVLLMPPYDIVKPLKVTSGCAPGCHHCAEIILYVGPTKERRCYNVTKSLIGWAHALNNPSLCLLMALHLVVPSHLCRDNNDIRTPHYCPFMWQTCPNAGFSAQLKNGSEGISILHAKYKGGLASLSCGLWLGNMHAWGFGYIYYHVTCGLMLKGIVSSRVTSLLPLPFNMQHCDWWSSEVSAKAL